jgi:fatty acid desaturase
VDEVCKRAELLLESIEGRCIGALENFQRDDFGTMAIEGFIHFAEAAGSEVAANVEAFDEASEASEVHRLDHSAGVCSPSDPTTVAGSTDNQVMHHELDRRALVTRVEWKDLLALNPANVFSELTLSLPWLVASLICAAQGLHIVALPLSFVFFLTGLRQVHGAFHNSIGLPRWADHAVMYVLSGLMLGSMHAVRINHLRHHRHCLGEEDVEGQSARLPAWRALVTGPLFPIRMHRKALQVASSSERRWIVAELMTTAVLLLAALALPASHWFRYHIVAMVAGQCLTAFFAVWTVHHDCEEKGLFARTIRGALKSRATWHMFYHLEHHLFPAVPTCRLAQLAERLDAIDPEISSKRVF